MRTKILLSLLFLCMSITSCKKEEVIPNLDDIRIIYCTPSELGNGLPLEIENTESGWQVRHVGASSKEPLALEPVYEINEDGDSIVVLHEHLSNGKLNGKYILHRSSMFENEYDGVSYIHFSDKDTTDYYSIIIEESTALRDNSDMKETIRKMMEFEGNESIGDNTKQRDMNLVYFIHSNPEVMHEPLKNEDLSIHDSSDGKLRIYSFTCYTGGNGVGSSFDNGIIQYETGNGEIAVLDYLPTLLFSSLTDFGESNFVSCTINNLKSVVTRGNTYYLLEALFSDSRPMSLNGSEDYSKTHDTVLFAFTIKDNKLTPAHILGQEWKIEIVGSQDTGELHFGFDEVTNIVSVPIVEGEGHLFNGEYRKITIR